MPRFVTQFTAIDKTDGIMKTFIGEYINANNFEEAEIICKTKKPYLTVIGQLVCELDFSTLKEVKDLTILN